MNEKNFGILTTYVVYYKDLYCMQRFFSLICHEITRNKTHLAMKLLQATVRLLLSLCKWRDYVNKNGL